MDTTISYSEHGLRAREPVITDLMLRALGNTELLSLAAGFTDNETLPGELIEKAVHQLRREDPGQTFLQYGPNRGRPGLLHQTAAYLDGLEAGTKLADEASIFICNGSQQALYLAVQTLCDPGDVILVETPTYFVFLEMLAGLGVKPVAIPAREDGAPDWEALPGLLRSLPRERVKALYLVSYFSNPSSRSLSEREKSTLAGILQREDFLMPVLEDAAYRELWFDQPHEAPSLFAMQEWEAFPKLYCGTFTKPFATGLKIGYGVCSDSEWRQRMLWLKGHQDFGSAHFNQAILETVLANGDYPKHLERLRAHYRSKARTMGAALENSGLRERGWSWEAPRGGLYYWLRGPDHLDTAIGSPFCDACVDAGVLYVPGDLCFSEGTMKNHVRLSFGSLPEPKLGAAVERFASVAPGTNDSSGGG